MLTIRNERPEDYAAVEELTRRAFYNVYVPGCTEHYLVHIMRGHRDFLPELDFVAELDGRLIGNIMYTRSWLTDGDGNRREILTFGPVSILPECQRKGYGKQLMEHSFARAREMGYGAVVIFGSPANYVSRGFVSCKKYRVSLEGGRYPAAMLVKELIPVSYTHLAHRGLYSEKCPQAAGNHHQHRGQGLRHQQVHGGAAVQNRRLQGL